MEALIKKDISKLTIDNIENVKEVYELIKDDLKVLLSNINNISISSCSDKSWTK